MIEVRNLYKYYGDFLALEDLNFTIEKGKILGFLGPNGSGKTTTMRIMSCFMPPTKGTVLIDGIDVTKDPMAVKKIIGYLPETPPLYLDMKVDEYLRYVALIKNVDQTQIDSRLMDVKEKCGLIEVSQKLIRALSKGYRQRVGIAQSLINNPEVLILDEPTVGLDPKQMGDIRNMVKSLKGSLTIILSTHILSEVTQICDDILIINRGKTVFKESLAQLGSKQDIEQLFIKHTYGLAESLEQSEDRREES